ncbi:DNA/RNA non-specific endonuclease [Streptomyces sp. CA2R106]|uniref:DNA/RNA non-specific endonuclease n=1 Tax=Streptomyces sp. CA2R106 TaxID=3120153 RepID=UPI00300B9133
MGDHYWRQDADEPTLPTWRQTPRAVPPPLGRPAQPSRSKRLTPPSLAQSGAQAATPAATPKAPSAPAPRSVPAAPAACAPTASAGPAGHGRGTSTWSSPAAQPAPAPAAAGPAPAPAPAPLTSPTARVRWAALVAAGVAAALAAGLLTWHGSGTQHPDGRAPFAAALVDLALQPGVGYRPAGAGATWSSSRATATGEALGETTVDGTSVTTLNVGGTTYVKMPGAPSSDAAGTGGGSDLAGKWVAGAAKDPGTGTDRTPDAGQSPATLANLLLAALDSDATVLPGDHPATRYVDGVPAIEATTPQGDLYVSSASPHRLLEFVPNGSGAETAGTGTTDTTGTSDAGTTGQQAALRTPLLPSPAAGAPAAPVTAAPTALYTLATATTADAFTVSYLTAAENSTLRKEIRDDTAELADAVDAGVSAKVVDQPELACSDAGCDVDIHITSITPTSEARRRITSGRVTVQLSATVTVDGEAAGSCTATAQMPLDSAGEISCHDSGAGPVYATQEAQKKQQAQAEAQATGAPVPYDVHSLADATTQVLAQVDTAALEQTQQEEQQLDAAPSPADVAAHEALTDDDPDEAEDCTRSRPSGAKPNGAGWILNTTGHAGRSETGQACLKDPPSNSSKEKKANPFGWYEARLAVRRLGLNPDEDLARCHIVAARFGGSNKLKANLSPCGQRVSNNGALGMSGFESEVAGVLARQPDGTVRYLVEPIYAAPDSSIPKGFVMVAVCYTPAGVPREAISRTVLNVVEAGGGLTDIGN